MSEPLLKILARLELSVEELQSKPIGKQIDYSKDIDSIKKELSEIRKLTQNKKEFDFKVEFEKYATLDFINNLYRKQ
jgi:hypothetical protein